MKAEGFTRLQTRQGLPVEILVLSLKCVKTTRNFDMTYKNKLFLYITRGPEKYATQCINKEP